MMAGGEKQKRHEVIPKIDLFNFDAPENQSSRYILNSPRSLKACSRLGIKPVQLLPKSLKEFSASTTSLGLKQDTLTTIYREFEKQRLTKLQAARREREKIITESKNDGHLQTPDVSTQRRPEDVYGRPQISKGRGGRIVEGVNVKRQVVQSWQEGSEHLDEKKRVHFNIPTATLSEKDQRLFEMMATRLAEDEHLSSLKESVSRGWQEEREHERRMKQLSQLSHQKKMIESQRRFQEQLSHLQSLKSTLTQEEEHHRQACLEDKWYRWNRSAQLQATQKAQLIQQKKFHEHEKKLNQERRLKDVKEEESLHRQMTRGQLEEMKNRAATNREAKKHREAMQKQFNKEAQRNRHERRRCEVEAQNVEEREMLKSSLTERLNCATQRYHTQLELKEAAIQQAADTHKQRASQCKSNAEKIEAELTEWRRELDHYHRQNMSRVEEMSQRLIEERKQKVHLQRVERERDHADKMKALVEEEEDQRLQYGLEMELKMERSETMKREKEEAVRKSREASHLGTKLRDQIKDQYLRNSFDRMAHQAQLSASLERRQPTSLTDTRNKSKVILG